MQLCQDLEVELANAAPMPGRLSAPILSRLARPDRLLADGDGAISGAIVLLIDRTRGARLAQSRALHCLGHGSRRSLALGGVLARPARIGFTHAPENPRLRGWKVDQDSVSNFRVGEPVRLIHPAPNRARIAIDLSGKKLKVEIVGEKIGG